MTQVLGDRAPSAPAAAPGPVPPAPELRRRGLHRFARRFMNPVVVRWGLAGGRRSPIGLVLHVGRRSGRPLATPLAVHRLGRTLVVPLTYGPGARWCLNVLAAGSCRVRLHGRELTAVAPRVVPRNVLPQRLSIPYRLAGIRDFLELTVPDET